MRWYKRLRFYSLSVSAKIFFTWLVAGVCCCLISTRASASDPDNIASTNAVLESYILRAAKKGSFNHSSPIFINVRAGIGSDSLFGYLSQWYKFYAEFFNFTQDPNRNNITILIGKDVLKEAKSGKITGFGSNFDVVNTRYDYCYVGAINENNSKDIYYEASILIDPSMGGDTRKCLLESFVRLFGFHFSLTLFVNANPLYYKAISGKSIDEAQLKAFQIREKCRPSVETPDFEVCVRKELQYD
ncbi:hypothetical protein D3C87_845610 [compost metagenome]|uniref:Uncharacterized protein n=1 Tax=Agrobacterium radiobacter TaxID=362 RepID=A0ABD5LIP8_AGRRD|nr:MULTISPECIES: hypothetical protein [Agrobacterium tumefaciens complex]KAB0458261.1 hypothetical protein F7R04_20640 [Agrobacterium tumefaciens]NIB12146.1 hypothetical protein [Agrobacterium radiobacter]